MYSVQESYKRQNMIYKERRKGAGEILKEVLKETEKKLNEPQYQHENEDWKVGLIIAQDIIKKKLGEIER